MRGLVLRKTKLKESDLIVELLSDEGSLVRAVAKGARKPKSSFASRLELGNSVELLCAPSRGLSIVQECRLGSARMGLRSDYDKLLCAEAALELLSKCAQEDLPQPKLLAASEAGLDCLAAAPAEKATAIFAATFLKTLAFVGLRPELRCCVLCGAPLENPVRFSDFDGGAVCPDCARETQTRVFAPGVLSTAAFLLHNPYSAIAANDYDPTSIDDVLSIAQALAKTHLDIGLKSLRLL